LWGHEFGITDNILAFPNDIEMFTANIKWSALGKSYAGSTYSLIYKIKKDAIQNKKVKEWLDNGQPLQASVRMIYVKLLSAFNTDDKDFAEQKAVFDKYYPLIANKEEFEEIRYFWVVKEAQNKAESSLLPYGSNSATGRIETKEDLEIEAVEDTSNEIPEPSIDTQTEQKNKVIIF